MPGWHHNSDTIFRLVRLCMGLMMSQLCLFRAGSILWAIVVPKLILLFTTVGPTLFYWLRTQTHLHPLLFPSAAPMEVWARVLFPLVPWFCNGFLRFGQKILFSLAEMIKTWTSVIFFIFLWALSLSLKIFASLSFFVFDEKILFLISKILPS